MAKVDLNTLRNWFKNGLKPNQQHFWNWMDSFWHKDEAIPMQQINGLGNALANKAEASQLANHSNDPDAHGLLNYIKRNDFLDSNGKIKTEKLQALALCDTIKASETTLADFVQNQSNYEFQKNDFIAIPNAGKYDLYLFVGDDKMVVDDYLPTGISNVNAAQIDGLTSYMADYIIGNMVLNRVGNSLHLGLERTLSDGSGNSSSFTQTFGIIDLDFMQLDLPVNTNGYALPNSLHNNGLDLIYQDENGIDAKLLHGDIDVIMSGLQSSGAVQAYKPLDGLWVGNTSFTVFGALRIELPIEMVDVLADISIDVSSCLVNQGFKAKLHGRLLSSNNEWQYVSTMLLTKGNDMSIRFGHTALGAPLIYIGELTTAWRFPIVHIDKVKAYATTAILEGFNISLESVAYENEKLLITNNKI